MRDPGRRAFIVFVAVGLLVLSAIAVGAVLVIDAVAERQAVAEDERTATRMAGNLVAPLLGAALAGDTERLRELDQLVDLRIRSGVFLEIDVWTPDGRILYSDDPRRIGARFPVPAEVVAAVERGVTTSGIETHPETGPATEARQVEVYLPLRLPDRVLAFEAYFSYQDIADRSAALREQLVPLAVGSLVLLQLVQVPIAASLARTVRRHAADRAALLERALTASEAERRTIAAGLHDGVVQDLAGAAFAIEALSDLPPDRRRATEQRVGALVRGSVDDLRRLMVDIYPPDLTGSGLTTAIAELAEPLRAAGVDVRLDVEPLPPLPPDAAATLYRVARELLVNVAKHAGAGTVLISLALDDDPSEPGADAVALRVVDDGVGPPPGGFDRRGDGHLGLRLVTDRLAEVGGTLTVGVGPEGGTAAEARLPVGGVPTADRRTVSGAAGP